MSETTPVVMTNLLLSSNKDDIYYTSSSTKTAFGCCEFSSETIIMEEKGNIYDPENITIIEPSGNFVLNCLKIYIGDKLVNQIPYNLFKYINYNICDVKKIGTETLHIYKIPMNFLQMEYFLKCGIYNDPIKFVICYSGDCEKICLNGKYVYTDELYLYSNITSLNDNSSNPINIIVDNYNKMESKYIDMSNVSVTQNELCEYNFKLNFNGLVNGIYILDLNIENMEEISLDLNYKTFLKVGKYTLPSYVKQLHDKCLYLPFDADKMHALSKKETAIDLSEISNVNLKIKTFDPINKCSFHAKFPCTITTTNGVVEIKNVKH